METTGVHRPTHVARRTLVSVLTGCAVVLTALTGLVVGWVAISFQIGSRATAEDYAVGAGGYGTATVLLLLGGVALRVLATAPWQLPVTLVLAVVLGLLTVSATADALATTDPGLGTNHWWDGAGGVLACPWSWWLVGVALASLRRPSRGLSG